MSLAEKEVLHCDQCGAPLESGASASGCLNCLLLGGSDETATLNRRFQHYEVCRLSDGATLHELGHGAMGITYRALDINLGSPVALKVISSRYSSDPEARERFRRDLARPVFLRNGASRRRNAGSPCASGWTVISLGYVGRCRASCPRLSRCRKTWINPS